MGSYGGQGGASSSASRRKIMTFTSSRLWQLPAWARGGIAELWGCGAGGNSGAANVRGATGAIATGFRFAVPITATNMSITIGAGPKIGGPGGDTIIAIDGAEFVRLGGGDLIAPGIPRFGGVSMLPTGGKANNGAVNQDTILEVVLAAHRGVALASHVNSGLYTNPNATVPNAELGCSFFGAGNVGYGFGGSTLVPAGNGYVAIELIEGGSA